MSQKIPAGLAPRASLDHLKHQAKTLLKSAREGNPHATSRLDRARSGDPAGLKLADAQRAIARENGCADWTELRAAVERGSIAMPANPEPEISLERIDQIWLDCTDLAAAEKFYGSVLGLKPTGHVPGMMTFFDCGGTNLLLGLRSEVRPNSILYFRLPGDEAAIQSAYNRLKSSGVKVGDSPHCIARNWNGCDVWLAFFFDPFGNQLAFKANVPR